MEDIIKKLKQSGLVGRGGACFPTWQKWSLVAKAVEDNKKSPYIICNASEGEPGVQKDEYILSHHADRVIDGIKIAIDFLMSPKAFIYINPSYYTKLKEKLERLTARSTIKVFKKHAGAGYVGGEETSAINHIEGRRIEPRLKPPFPTTRGLFGSPTLINNVETFYAVSLIARGEYKNKRFITINGDCLWTGVYEMDENLTIEKILRTTKNYPDFDFFVQAGGDGSGEVLNKKQLKRGVLGSGSITVHSIYKHDPLTLFKEWIDFFTRESCGQCTPCREGTYRIRELLYAKKPDWKTIFGLLDNLADTSFCALGCAVPIPFRSYAKNVLSVVPDKRIKLPKGVKNIICECFK